MNKIDKLRSLEMEAAELQPVVNRHRELTDEIYKLKASIFEEEKRVRYAKATFVTDYEESIYPGMGTEGKSGSAYFKSKEDADELINCLFSKSYYYGYILDWSGPGHYEVVPTYNYDHDREVVYTATFKKTEIC